MRIYKNIYLIIF